MYSEKAILQQRYESFRQRMAEEGINLAIIARPTDFYHFTLYNPIVFSMLSFVIIPLEGQPTVLVNALRGPRAAREIPFGDVKCYGKWSDNPSIAPDPYEAIRIVAESYGLGQLRIGSEKNFLPINDGERIKAKLGVDAIADITGAMFQERLIKDELAIDRLRKSAVLSNAGMNTLVDGLRAGLTEQSACAAAVTEINRLAESRFPELEVTGFGTAEEAIQYSYGVFCGSGIRSAFGAVQAQNHVPQAGELVLPVCIVKLGGYATENERSLYVGQLDSERERVFRTVLEAHQSVFDLIRPGNTFAQLYHAAADVFTRNGYEPFLPGRIGHGMGIGNHEWPSLDPCSEKPLQPGMVFTVEPGIMSERFGGVRPSDTVLVTEDGFENLTNTELGFMKI